MSSQTYLVTLNWNSSDRTAALIGSLGDDVYRVVVVDNGSEPSEAQKFRELALTGKRVTTIELPENVGFAAGTNAGLRQVLQWGEDDDIVVIANNDSLVGPRTIEELRSVLLANHGVIAASPVLRGDQGTIWYGGGSIDRRWCRVHVKREWVRGDEPADTDFVTLAFLAIRLGNLRRIGLLDERYFFGQEEWDFALRCQELGRTVVHPQAIATHAGSGSHDNQDSLFVYNGYRNRIQFARRWKKGFTYRAWTIWFAAFLLLIRPLRAAIRRNSSPVGEFKLGLLVLVDSGKFDHVSRQQLRVAAKRLGSVVLL